MHRPSRYSIWLSVQVSVVVAIGLLAIHQRLAAQATSAPHDDGRYPYAPSTAVSCRCVRSRDDVVSIERLLDPLLEVDCAVTLQPVYYGEMFTNVRGGLSTNGATQYQALLDLPVALDLEKARLPLPGSFFLLAQNTHGRGLTEHFVGDSQVISNIDSFQNIMQISEYWWEFRLFDQGLAVRLGKQDVNSEFLVMDLARDFIQSSFGLSPSSGFPSYPHASMAAVLLADLTPSVTLKAGIWDVLADGGGWGLSGNDVTITFGELECQYVLFDGQLPGALDVGIGYLSGGVVAPRETLSSGYGYYIQLEQLVIRENPYSQGDAQGLGGFVSYFPRFPNGAPPVRAIGDAFVAGVVYKGLVPGRDEDVVGAGFAWAELYQGGTNREAVVEAFYKADVTTWLSVQPDLQYIASPSGIHRDALAAGIRFQMAL